MYINSRTRDAQDNDMFYYFLANSLTNEFHTTVLLYADVYTITNIPVAVVGYTPDRTVEATVFLYDLS